MPLFNCVKGVDISAISCAVPARKFTLSEYAPNLIDEKTAKRMAHETGFHTLRITSENMTTADLFTAAAENVLDGVDRESICALVFVTQTPDHIIPATSHILQDRLGLSNNVLCLDITEGCSGFVNGFYVASLLASQMNSRVLLGCGDTLSKITSPDDRATRCIFGDEAAAILIEPGKQDIPFMFASYGERKEVIIMENSGFRLTDNPKNGGCIYLDGIEILNFSLNEVPETVSAFMAYNNITDDDISVYACHQANKLIVENLADTLGVRREKMPFTSGSIGNESSASIPSVIVNSEGGELFRRTLCCGFGVGMSIGVCYADFSGTKTSKVELS